jgi:hypothetical protein
VLAFITSKPGIRCARVEPHGLQGLGVGVPALGARGCGNGFPGLG